MKFTFHLENTTFHPSINIEDSTLTKYEEKQFDLEQAKKYLSNCSTLMNELVKVENSMQIPAKEFLEALLRTICVENIEGEILVLESPKTYKEKEFQEVFLQYLNNFKSSDTPGVIPADVFSYTLGLYTYSTQKVLELGIPNNCIHLVVDCKNIPDFENGPVADTDPDHPRIFS